MATKTTKAKRRLFAVFAFVGLKVVLDFDSCFAWLFLPRNIEFGRKRMLKIGIGFVAAAAIRVILCLLSSITDFLKVVAVVVVAVSDNGCQTHRVEFRRRWRWCPPSLIFGSRLAAGWREMPRLVTIRRACQRQAPTNIVCDGDEIWVKDIFRHNT
jgi:hypothetical protein